MKVSWHMQTDQQLIKKIKKRKSEDAANVLISRYYKEIYVYTYRQVGEMELAKDLTQEIWLNVLDKLATYNKKKASFRTWLYSIASNKITDYYRSARHRYSHLEVSLEQKQDNKDCSSEIYSEQKLIGEMEDLSETIIRREMIGKIMSVVSEYKEDWVLIFQKKCFEECTFADIANELNVSESTVKSRFYQMIKNIKKVVEMDG